MIPKINDRLNEYLEFDNSILFFDPLIRIFGGAIRDSIADEKINDVDILCGAQSIRRLEFILEENEPIFYVEILTDKKIKIERFMPNDNILKYSASCVNSTKTLGKLLSLNKRYKQFKESSMHKIILNEIKRNVVE